MSFLDLPGVNPQHRGANLFLPMGVGGGSNAPQSFINLKYDGNFLDSSVNNFVSETNGVISPIVYQCGTGSFDATLSANFVRNTPVDLGLNATIEAFVYVKALVFQAGQVLSFWAGPGNTLYNAIVVKFFNQGFGAYISNQNVNQEFIQSSAPPLVQTWYHLCLMRVNGVYNFYINGMLVGQGSASANASPTWIMENQTFYVSARPGFADSNTYIDCVRVTLAALYPEAGFTVPTCSEFYALTNP